MSGRILITGSAGLIGSALRNALDAYGYRTQGLDIRAIGMDFGDICDAVRIAEVIDGCDGIVHLAGVSRVVWGEADPDKCRLANVDAVANLLTAVERRSKSPWLIFASSREVYGETDGSPVHEDSPLRPINVYGRSKVAGEQLVCDARARGVRTAIVRFSNVYGRILDHSDRVIPAFARAAATGGQIRVDGTDNTFDFTHVDDVVLGVLKIIDLLQASDHLSFDPIHFASGRSTSLRELAQMANELGGLKATIVEAPSRNFDVSRFRGCTQRASNVLGWSALIALDDGLKRLVQEFRELPRA
jgi:UDP-glucose 4-epimerase